jgi:hypothetical protein
VSSASPVSASQADTSQVNAPTSVSGAPGGSSHGRIVLSFTPSTGTAPSSYTAMLCTDAAMTQNCQTFTFVSNGTTVSGLQRTTLYYIVITANGPTGYLSTASSQGTGTSN